MQEKFIDSEQLQLQHLDLIAEQTVKGIVIAFDDRIGVEMFPKGIEVRIDTSEKLEDRFPVLIETKPTVLHFNTNQYQELIDDFGLSRGLSSEYVARLYIGCSIPLKLLEQSVVPQDKTKVERLAAIMADVNSIANAVRCSRFGEVDQHDQLLRLMQADEKTLWRINSLRFGIGVLFMAETARGNPQYGEEMKRMFRGVMCETLLRRGDYVKFLEGHGYSALEAETIYGEHITDIELAACFPMSSTEINTILDVCWGNYAEPTMPTEEVFIPTEMNNSNGFHIERK